MGIPLLSRLDLLPRKKTVQVNNGEDVNVPAPTPGIYSPCSPTSRTAVSTASQPQTPYVSERTLCETIPSFSAANTPPKMCPTTPSRTLAVEDFEFIKYLGKGGFGIVFLVLDKCTRRLFALKVVLKEKMSMSAYARMFEEVRIGQAVAHSKWLLGVEGCWNDSGCFYILMKYIPGGSLSRIIRQSIPLSHEARMFFLADLVIALEELHSTRTAHRDIRPDNILVGREGHPIIADFGLARQFGVSKADRPWELQPAWAPFAVDDIHGECRDGWAGQDVTVGGLGTPAYTAPEVTRSDAYCPFRADIFSLGVTFYKLVFGRMPFGLKRGMDREETARYIRDAPLEFPANTDVNVKDLLSKMLERDPHRRITLSQIKAHPLFHQIDWAYVASRTTPNPMKHEILRDHPSSIIEPDKSSIPLPPGQPWEAGQEPFPWFNYVGSALLEPADTQYEPTQVAHLPSTLSPDDAKHPNTRRRRIGLRTKLTEWRNRTAEVKPCSAPAARVVVG